MKDILLWTGVISIIVLALCVMPIWLIWSLNTLLGLYIPYGFFEILAAFSIITIFTVRKPK